MTDVDEKLEQLQATGEPLAIDVALVKSGLSSLKDEIREFRLDIREIRGRLERDFRLLFGALMAVAVGLSGLMAKGFGWLH